MLVLSRNQRGLEMGLVRGGCKLTVQWGNTASITAGGLFRSSNRGDDGLLTCAHPIATRLKLEESNEPQILPQPFEVYFERADGQDPVLLGVVKKVWYSPQKGWDHCFVEKLNAPCAENELVDLSGDMAVPVQVDGLICSHPSYSRDNLIGTEVTRYGYQNPKKTHGTLFKYLHGDNYVSIDERRFTNVFLINTNAGIRSFAQHGDSGGPVVVKTADRGTWVVGFVIGLGIFQCRAFCVVSNHCSMAHLYQDVEE